MATDTPLLPSPARAASPAATGGDDDPLWYKDAVIYQAHVKSFYDSNNDGIGDFRGLTQKIDYLQASGRRACGCCPSSPRRCGMTGTTSPTI